MRPDHIRSSQADAARFEDFHRQWRPFVRAVAASYVSTPDDADEAASLVFVRVWKDGTWRDLRAPKAYLARTTRWEAGNLRRSAKPVVPLTEKIAESMASGGPLPDELASRRERRRLMEERIRGLPPRCSEVMMLRLDGLSQREIAARLQIGVGAVQKQVTRGRRLLGEWLSTFVDGGGKAVSWFSGVGTGLCGRRAWTANLGTEGEPCCLRW